MSNKNKKLSIKDKEKKLLTNLFWVSIVVSFVQLCIIHISSIYRGSDFTESMYCYVSILLTALTILLAYMLDSEITKNYE